MSAVQQKLFTAEAEAELYHCTQRPGFFSVLARKESGPKRQRSYKLQDMPTVLQLLDASRDTWISQAEFTKPNRRVVNLWRVGLLFADIDTYNVEAFTDLNPDVLTNILLHECEIQCIPAPSIIIFSGRGLQAKWLLQSALPRAALPRWNAAQANLVEKLSGIGADKKAKDASRVLRLVRTTNEKSGDTVHVTHVTENNGQPVRYCFDYLAEFLLPFSRQQLEEMRQERAEQKALRDSMKIIKGGKIGHLRGFSGRQLAWHRLEDLRKLADLRGGVEEGSRMLNLFWQLNFLLLSGATNSVQMWHEAQALARAIDSKWHYDKSALSTLYSKAQAYESGNSVEFNGQKYPALYTPRNSTLIDQFEISDDEQKQLQTIISRDIARERDAERKRKQRQAEGAVSRQQYIAQSVEANKPWETLGISRRTWYRRKAVDNNTFAHVNNSK